MDLVREIKDVRFTMAHKGYDCAAVDSYLAKLRGNLTQIEADQEATSRRISELEDQVAEGGGSSETEGTLRRTLLLAQRLADETEAEANAAATDLVNTATAEASAVRESAQFDSDQIRNDAASQAETVVQNANAEAEGIRREIETELAASRAEVEQNSAANEAASGRARDESRSQAAALLAEAETAGQQRVAALELTAQTQAAEMREPIRAEVAELESVRGRLLVDISELEAHLEAQRVRVRNAVDALRVGMSGSIEDLERVAEDDELLGIQSAPITSGATGADVVAAPDIEIRDRVQQGAPEQPTVDSVEATSIAQVAESAPLVEEMQPDEYVAPEYAAPDHATAEAPLSSVPEPAAEQPVIEELAIEEQPLEQHPVVEEIPVVEETAVVEEYPAVEEQYVEQVAVADEPVFEEAIVDEPVQPLAAEAPVADYPVEPVGDVPIDQAPLEQVPADVPIDQVPLEQVPVDQQFVNDTAVEDAVQWADPAVTPDLADAPTDSGSSNLGGLGMVGGAAAATGGFVAANAMSGSGPITEPIPVVGTEVDPEIDVDALAAEGVEELDAESSELFGTEMEQDGQVEEMEVEGSVEAGSFVKRFAESLDVTPIVGR